MSSFLASLLLLSATAEAAPPDWTGVWQGRLENLPSRRPAASPVSVRMEIGPWPTADGACGLWRTTYSQEGTVRQVKDYRLCRGKGADDLFIDEGDGIKLTARYIGTALYSPFKYDELVLVSVVRMRGKYLQHEILTFGDKDGKGVVPMVPRNVQRMELKRVAKAPQAAR